MAGTIPTLSHQDRSGSSIRIAIWTSALVVSGFRPGQADSVVEDSVDLASTGVLILLMRTYVDRLATH